MMKKEKVRKAKQIKEPYVLQVDKETKDEFLDSPRFTTQTKKNIFSTLAAADKYEALTSKSIYNLSYEQRDDLIATQYKNKTLSTVEATVSILKGYIDFCISKNIVPHFENRFAVLNIEDMRNFVSQQSTDNRYIPWEQIKEIEKDVYNDMDKLILEVVYSSIRGRTQKGETCAELINMSLQSFNEESNTTIENINENDNTILVYGNNKKLTRKVQIKPETIKLIKKVSECEEYIGNNGEVRVRRFGIPKEEKIDLPTTGYVFRSIKDRNETKVHPLFFIQQIKKIGKWTGVNYITLNNLYFSGMMEKVLNIFKNTGEYPTKKQYLTIVQEADYGKTLQLQMSYAFKLEKLSKPYIEKLKEELLQRGEN